jgi:hypothetical protein
MQSVLDCESLAEELRIPSDFNAFTRRREAIDDFR